LEGRARWPRSHAHDLLKDLDKELVLADIRAWIDARI
jgi:hypothetical protein